MPTHSKLQLSMYLFRGLEKRTDKWATALLRLRLDPHAIRASGEDVDAFVVVGSASSHAELIDRLVVAAKYVPNA